MSENKCPLCSSTNLIVYLTTHKFNILKCNICTNAWTSPPPGNIDYESLDFHLLEISKEDQTPKSIKSLPKQWQKTIAQQISLIKKHLKGDASILEIGCGEGIFLNELRQNGYDVHGLEPSITATERATKTYGLDVAQGYFPSEKIKGKKYDLIMMSHVLEHIGNPNEILLALKEYLLPKGKVLLIQTNYLGLIPRLRGKKWYAWLPHQHFWHFTPHGISYITKSMGFKEIDHEFSSLVHTDSRISIKNLLMSFFEKGTPKNLKDQFHIMLSIT